MDCQQQPLYSDQYLFYIVDPKPVKIQPDPFSIRTQTLVVSFLEMKKISKKKEKIITIFS